MTEVEHVKQALLEEPMKLKELLESYSYCSFKFHNNYMNFARDEEGSSKSIVIRFKDNDALFVQDYPLNICKDIFSYIMMMRNVTFREVILRAKKILGISNVPYVETPAYAPFGGIYNKIRQRKKILLPVLDESILERYSFVCNRRFLNDHIGLKAQRMFGIRYDAETQSIVIPIRNEIGELVGIKARKNSDNPEGNKYFYLEPVMITHTLFGYAENYNYLVDNTIVVFEAEKSVMQCYSYGIRNCVSIGSSTLSRRQAQMLLSACPKKIILAHDKSSMFDVIKQNAETLKEFGRLREFKVCYVDMENDDTIEPKSSPSDLGRDKFIEIISKQIKEIVWN